MQLHKFSRNSDVLWKALCYYCSKRTLPWILFCFIVLFMTIGFVSDKNKDFDPETRRVKVVVLGYRHGGSSITGAILASHPSAHYVYEPIHYMKDPDISGVAAGDRRFPITTRVRQKQVNKGRMLPEPLDHVTEILNCRYTRYVKDYMYFPVDSKDMESFHKCYLKNPANESCYKEVRKNCLQKRAIIMKTVRMNISEIVTLMKADPEIRLVFVIRDPRGNRCSRLHLKDVNFTRQVAEADNETIFQLLPDYSSFATQCKIMTSDLKSAQDLPLDLTERTLVFRYEDLAEDPIRMAKKLYSFVGLSFPLSVEKRIEQMTSAKSISKIREKIVSNDSSRTAHEWRTLLPWEESKKVEMDCSYVFHTMNYYTFTFEENLRDMSIPARGLFLADSLLYRR